MNEPGVVRLEGIAKTYAGNELAAVESVDLEIGAGSFFSLLGPSGCGKTTTLRIIAGFEYPNAGRVFIGGRDVTGLSPRDRDIAMVFQDYALYPQMTVFDNLAFGLRARRRPEAEVRERVGEVARLLGLEDLLRRMPRALSGGQRRRVVLGRALARRPAILLLDEPLSGLDTPLRAALRADLIELHRRLGTTTLHVTHDQGEALAMADRLAMLDAGRLAQLGTPHELYDRPATRAVARFLGSPPMDVLPVEVEVTPDSIQLRLRGVEHDPWTLPRGTPWVELCARRGPGPIDLGLRPEQVRVGAGPEDSPALTGVVRRVEPIGHETLATLAVGPATLTLRLPPRDPTRPGDVRALRLDLERACLFDPGTGARIIL